MQKTNQKEFRIEKVIKRKRSKVCVKWKGYDSSFNSWIDKKRHVKMGQYSPNPYHNFGGNVKGKLW